MKLQESAFLSCILQIDVLMDAFRKQLLSGKVRQLSQLSLQNVQLGVIAVSLLLESRGCLSHSINQGILRLSGSRVLLSFLGSEVQIRLTNFALCCPAL